MTLCAGFSDCDRSVSCRLYAFRLAAFRNSCFLRMVRFHFVKEESIFIRILILIEPIEEWVHDSNSCSNAAARVE